MKTVCKINMCNGCMACVDKCPMKCIYIQDNLLTYNAVRDMEKCINCGLCAKVCPNNAIVERKEPILWKQGWASSDIREKSSSGGVASAIIKSFIEDGGYVASCLFKNGEFVFDITNDLETAKRFAGSKYVKSNPKGIYIKVQERLKTDKVLFLGLPCQVAGIKNFIKDQSNLYTVDLICHGTPSPQILTRFLKENGIDIKNCDNIKFRSKTQFCLSDREKIITPEGMDDYLMAFLDSLDYTENCYSCQYATAQRISDVTLGDSWGTELKSEEENGVSLILVETEKGKELINESQLDLFDVDIENAKNENHQLRHPSVINPKRDFLLKSLSNGRSFSFTIFKLYKKTVAKRNIKKVLIRLHLMKNLWGGVKNKYQIIIYR